MSKTLAVFLLILGFVLPEVGFAQVLKKAETVSRGDFVISGSPTVFIDDNNDIALFLYGLYGLGGSTNLRVRAGFFEAENYFGGNFEWTLRRRGPSFTFSLGGHYQNDPGLDATFNFSGQLNNNFDIYGGLDTDLILDDNPDLPLWLFLGFSYDLLDYVDILAEFNYGFVEIAPHILATGFVFYF
jgi:hypothetical protein